MQKKLFEFFKNESYAIISLMVLLTIFFLVVFSLTEGFVGGADSLTHYKFSRYSWQYPEFLLHHWAKPVFTLLTSPFAQFGHDGVALFNLLGGLTSGFIAFLIARKLGYKSGLLAPIMLLFMPIYTFNVLSGLTEVLFGLFIIASTWLCLDKKYWQAALLISFSHLVRTEGIFIIPVFGLYFLIIKQYRHIPWLFVGTVVYSIIGYFHFNDIFWLITRMPYTGAKDLYGTGAFTHFFKLAPQLFGNISVIFILLGVVTLIVQRVILNQKKVNDAIVLILLPFFIYFFAHVMMWWSGIGNSLGMHRYVVAIVPLGAILALAGFDMLKTQLDLRVKSAIPGYILTLVVIILFINQPFKHLYNFPYKLDGMEKVMYEASNFIKEKNLDDNKIYYNDPAFFYFIGFNPYDTLQSQSLSFKPYENREIVKPGEIVIWDGHFTPLRKIDLDSLKVSPLYNEVATFEPAHPFKIFDTDYKVVIFQRKEQ
jgi:hypothetical protein